MLNLKRQILLALLNQITGLRSQDLASRLNVTPRTIRNNIDELNQSFNQKVIGYKKPFFYLLNSSDVTKYISLKTEQTHYPNYIEDRPFLVYYQLYKNDFVKIQTLSSTLHVGRNEVEKTVKKLRQIGKKYQLNFDSSEKGINLVGKKVWKDYFLASLSVNRISRLVKNQYLNIIFKNEFVKKEFEDYLKQIDKNIQKKYGIKLADKALYILALMHFINPDIGKSKDKEFSAFYKEFILYNNSLIKRLNENSKSYYRILTKVYPYHDQLVFNGIGNISNHILLAKSNPLYFPLSIKNTKIAGININYTEKDCEFISHFIQAKETNLKKRIVLYSSDIFQISKYEDKLLPLCNLFSDLEIKVTNNLFDLNELLHIKNEQIIFVADKERISIDDENYNIHFLKLQQNVDKEIIRFLIK